MEIPDVVLKQEWWRKVKRESTVYHKTLATGY